MLSAFFVGINNYYDSYGEKDHNRSLLGASDDAKLIYSSLSESRPKASVLLLNEESVKCNLTRNSIFLQLVSFVEKTTDTSNFLFYFAGHASLVKSKLILHPSDFIEKISLTSGIVIDDILDILLKRKGKKVIILDCCRTNMDEIGYRTPYLFSSSPTILSNEDTMFFFSCSPKQYSYEIMSSSQFSGGIFSYFLSKRIASSNFKNGKYNFQNFVNSIIKRTSEHANDYLGQEQTPVTYGANPGSIIL